VGGSWADPTKKPREVKNPDGTSPGSKEGKGNETWVIGLTVYAAQQSKTSFRKSRAGLEAAEGNDLFSNSVDERRVPALQYTCSSWAGLRWLEVRCSLTVKCQYPAPLPVVDFERSNTIIP